MLKVRVIPTLLMRDGGLWKGPSFDSWRRVGAPMQAVKVFNRRDVDELVLLDIGATAERRTPDLELIARLARECFVPLTVGGGIGDLQTVRSLLVAGADKISLNSSSYDNLAVVSEAARRFGSQCVVASVDFRRMPDGTAQCFSHAGTRPTGKDAVSWACELAAAGAGEILLTSIERDGTMQGYDLDVTARVCAAVSIPVIASGGAGSYQHMLEALQQGGASAVSAASIYLFTEATPREAKEFLRRHGVNVRDSHANRNVV